MTARLLMVACLLAPAVAAGQSTPAQRVVALGTKVSRLQTRAAVETGRFRSRYGDHFARIEDANGLFETRSRAERLLAALASKVEVLAGRASQSDLDLRWFETEMSAAYADYQQAFKDWYGYEVIFRRLYRDLSGLGNPGEQDALRLPQ